MARDGMSGSLNYTVLIEIAKLNGIKDDVLTDFIDFVNEMELQIAIKKSEKTK